jgi:hypothetical protein
VVAVPEAAVDENRRVPLPEDDVRTSLQLFRMKSVSVTQPVEQTADSKFRLCVLTAHAAHHR